MSNQIRIERLTDSILEAERFLKRAKAARNKIQGEGTYPDPCPAYAAAKRSSMDLTRTLATLRKSLY